jgi:hypothetical protein
LARLLSLKNQVKAEHVDEDFSIFYTHTKRDSRKKQLKHKKAAI